MTHHMMINIQQELTLPVESWGYHIGLLRNADDMENSSFGSIPSWKQRGIKI
jgi:hypothetical protein